MEILLMYLFKFAFVLAHVMVKSLSWPFLFETLGICLIDNTLKSTNFYVNVSYQRNVFVRSIKHLLKSLILQINFTYKNL